MQLFEFVCHDCMHEDKMRHVLSSIASFERHDGNYCQKRVIQVIIMLGAEQMMTAIGDDDINEHLLKQLAEQELSVLITLNFWLCMSDIHKAKQISFVSNLIKLDFDSEETLKRKLGSQIDWSALIDMMHQGKLLKKMQQNVFSKDQEIHRELLKSLIKDYGSQDC